MVRIRRLRRSDFDGFCKNQRSYAAELRNNPGFGLGAYGRRVTKSLLQKRFSELYKRCASGSAIVLVADNGNSDIVGEGIANGNAWFEGPHIADLGVSVREEHRREGVGTALLRALIKECEGRYEIVTGSTFSTNTASKRLLKKLGFKRWARGHKFVKRGRLYMDSEFYYLRL